MRIIDATKTDQSTIIQTACQVLAAGGLVIYPTETTYGIGADATNQAAVDQLLRYKSRRAGKPLSIAVADQAMAEGYVRLNTEAQALYQTFLPGPVTVVSMVKKKPTRLLARGVASERGTVGVRIPNYPLIRQLVAQFGRPITASSANASYKKRPYNVSDILNNISAKQKGLIDLIIDAGPLPPNEPSTVIDTTLEQPTVLRQGRIELTQATKVISQSPEETQALGEHLVNLYRHDLNEKALIFALVGPLGAGKTQLAKGIGRALGISQPITSPTFTLSREYRFSTPVSQNRLIHLDTWRLFNDQEFIELGFSQMTDRQFVIIVEWADKVRRPLQALSDEAKIIWVQFDYGRRPNERLISYGDSPLEPAKVAEKPTKARKAANAHPGD